MSNAKQQHDREVRRFRQGMQKLVLDFANGFANRATHLAIITTEWSHKPVATYDGLRNTAKLLSIMAGKLEYQIKLIESSERMKVSSLQDEANVQLREAVDQEVAE
jgi:hypothetical protein